MLINRSNMSLFGQISVKYRSNSLNDDQIGQQSSDHLLINIQHITSHPHHHQHNNTITITHSSTPPSHHHQQHNTPSPINYTSIILQHNHLTIYLANIWLTPIHQISSNMLINRSNMSKYRSNQDKYV